MARRRPTTEVAYLRERIRLSHEAMRREATEISRLANRLVSPAHRIRRHPVVSVAASAAFGFFLARGARSGDGVGRTAARFTRVAATVAGGAAGRFARSWVRRALRSAGT